MKKLALTGFSAIFSVVLFIGALEAQPTGPGQGGKLKDAKMVIDLNSQEKQKIEEGLRKKYDKVAVSPEGQFKYPTGQAGLKALKYDSEILQDLPEAVAATYCGVGNPFSLGPVSKGEKVLDVGCGTGVDAVFAAKMVGSAGAVTGIDLVPAMLSRAKENARLAGVANITFIESSAEKLPFPDASFDVVISNGVFNLVVDKFTALKEVWRVLKPGGRLMLADQVQVGKMPKETGARVASWFG
jgi:arsenite methyltransferase